MGQGLVQYPGTGCVVEYMQGNAPQIAWVLEEQGGRLRLLLPNRRETAIQAARLLPWSGPSHEGVTLRDKAIELLGQHKIRRDELTLSFSVLELWELAQGEVERAPAPFFADLVAVSPDADAIAACGHALMDCKSHFRFQPPDFEVLPEDIVNTRLKEQESAQKREALINQGTGFMRQLWEAYVKGKPVSDALLDPAIARRLKTALMARIADPDSPDDEALWKQLVKGLPEEALPLYLAQAWGIVGAHHNFWLDRAGYDPGNGWSEAYGEAMADLKADVETALAVMPDEVLPFISIDSSTTKDIDDAFHIRERAVEDGGGWVLTLALACPALAWPFGSAFDKAVAQRATSIYVPEATHHMLPETLGTEEYSLLAGQNRPALLVECQVSPDGALCLCAPRVGKVRLAANLCYEACEAVLSSAVLSEEALSEQVRSSAETEPVAAAAVFGDQLRMGLALAQTRLQYRLGNGAVIIQRPDLHFELEGEGEAIRVSMEDEAPVPLAHLLVAEHMLLANAALARWAGEQGISLLFRTQNVTIPKEFAGIWTDPVDIARVVRVLAPACLETVPRPHAGVGEAAYAPSTSPLRRYPDLLNEAQILHQLAAGAPRWSKEALDTMLPGLNARLDAAGLVQRQRPRYWKLVYLRQEGDVWRQAVITDETEMFVTVNLPKEQLVLRARRHIFGERAMIGQLVEVRLGKIRPVQGDVSLVEARDL